MAAKRDLTDLVPAYPVNYKASSSQAFFCLARIHQGKRIKPLRFLEVLRGEMRIAHGHRQALMPQDALKGQHVTAAHHEVARKGVTKTVRHLPFRQTDACALDCLPECRPGPPHVEQQSDCCALSGVISKSSTPCGNAFKLTLARDCCQPTVGCTDHATRLGMALDRRLHLHELPDFSAVSHRASGSSQAGRSGYSGGSSLKGPSRSKPSKSSSSSDKSWMPIA